jgi:Glutamine amidotransferases class-II
VNLGEVMREVPDARMAVIATEPLTRDETWEKATPGSLWVFRAGERLLSFPGNAKAQAVANASSAEHRGAARPSAPPMAAAPPADRL